LVPSEVPLTTTQRILDVAPLVLARGAMAGLAGRLRLGVDLLDGKNPFTTWAGPRRTGSA